MLLPNKRDEENLNEFFKKFSFPERQTEPNRNDAHRWKILKMRKIFRKKWDVINQLQHSENSLAASRWDSVERWRCMRLHATVWGCVNVYVYVRVSKLARDVGHLNLPLHGMCLCFHMIMQGIRMNKKEPTFHLIWFYANEAKRITYHKLPIENDCMETENNGHI